MSTPRMIMAERSKMEAIAFEILDDHPACKILRTCLDDRDRELRDAEQAVLQRQPTERDWDAMRARMRAVTAALGEIEEQVRAGEVVVSEHGQAFLERIEDAVNPALYAPGFGPDTP